MRAELYDAGTELRIDSLLSTPGMDHAYFRELDMEYQWPTQLQGEINERLRETHTTATLRPWPVPFPGRCWIDWTKRYNGPDGGLTIKPARWDIMFDDYALVPAPLTQIPDAATYDPNADMEDARLIDAKTTIEIAAENSQPTEWLRQPLHNEIGGKHGGTCDLKQPTVMQQLYHVGDMLRPVINYSPLFAPVDGRHPEWYNLLRADGTQIGDEKKLHYMSMMPEGDYRLYLRPANWRWVVTVWANYLYVSWFEMFPTREIFTTAYFNRPPVYPHRHDLIKTTQNPYFEWHNIYYSIDGGISAGFESSRGAAFLRSQMINAQWWTQSEAYIFTGNDPATIAIWLWPPEPMDIVLGIGRVDTSTGEEEILWLQQAVDLTAEYERQIIGSYIDLGFSAI
jgi:hypothetical protein